MAINREVTVVARLQAENRLSPELARAKADAEAASASVQKLANQQMGGATGASLKPQFGPMIPPEPNLGPKLPPLPEDRTADAVRKAIEEQHRLSATYVMTGNQLQLFKLKQEGATAAQLAAVRAAQEQRRSMGDLSGDQGGAGLSRVSMDEYRMASRLARAHTIVGLGAAALASTGIGGGPGQIVGSALGGAAAGAFFGPQGAIIGAAIGGTAAVFKVIQEGADKAKQAAEQFKNAAAAAANSIISSETSIRHLRETGRITETELATLAGRFAGRIFGRPESERPTAATAALPEARAELARLRALAPAYEGPPSWERSLVSFFHTTPTRTAAELRSAEATVIALETVSRSGIDRERTPSSFGDAGAIRERIMMDLSGPSSAPERTATAVEALRSIIETAGVGPLRALGAWLARPTGPAPV